MDKEQIKQLLSEKKLTSVMIAEALGVTPQAVRNVIYGNFRSKRIAKAISKILDLPLETVFPFYEKEQKKALAKQARQQELNEKLAKLA